MLLTVSVSPRLKEMGKALILHHIWNVNDYMNFLITEFFPTPGALPDQGLHPRLLCLLQVNSLPLHLLGSQSIFWLG